MAVSSVSGGVSIQAPKWEDPAAQTQIQGAGKDAATEAVQDGGIPAFPQETPAVTRALSLPTEKDETTTLMERMLEAQKRAKERKDRFKTPKKTNYGEIPMEASARHVHLTREAAEALFGPGERLSKKRDLSQPGEFLSQQRVRLVTAKGELANVAVLGPERSAVQVELSLTDARTLGVAAPVNLSGDLTGAGDVYIVGEKGMISAPGSVIAAKAHIHMTPADARRFGVADGQRVRVRARTARPVTFEEVVVRVKESFALAMHIDFDEANACALRGGEVGEIIP